MAHFVPSRLAAVEALSHFLPKAGHSYASLRNYDLGPGGHIHVSRLSPYLRHRVITEDDVLQAVLGRHSLSSAEKFVQEVFWRTYWKGWLEMRPGLWAQYHAAVERRMDDVQTQGGLRQTWEDACYGQTGIDCFDAWARELVDTGYLHNHARMWFASIWIFTLKLPWELGADFFLRHLLDGDPASNTLGWRWVAGLQTKGKTYLAQPSNIEKYTESRFAPDPGSLARHAEALEGPDDPERSLPPVSDALDPGKRTVFILHEDDLAPGWLFERGLSPVATATLTSHARLSPLTVAPRVRDFREALVAEAASRWSARLGPVTVGLSTPSELLDWAKAHRAEQIVCSYAPVGGVATCLGGIKAVPVRQVLRPYDAHAWPHATAGFFKFKRKIPELVAALKGLKAA